MSLDMLLGAWGTRAGELLPEAGHREGRLAMPSAPHGAHGTWRCWLFGEPLADTTLRARSADGPVVPDGGNVDLASALAQALEDRGEGALGLLWGRFAAVLYDRARDCCWVARDQMGAQPVVYARVADGALFAEHERELLDTLPRTPAPDRLALLGWVENGMPPAPRTLYAGIERIPAGGRLTLGERVAVERWWQPRFQGVERGTPSELGERLRDAAFAAVARAAAGARRPAVKLSGGLDSSCVAAGLAADGPAARGAMALGGTFAAYAEADERELIEATAHQTGLALELIAYESEHSMLAPALAHIDRWRLPPGSPTLFLWQPLFARARSLGVDVLLDGEGGDEVFGFAAYLIADRLRRGRLADAWSLTAQIPGIGSHPDPRVRLRVLRHYGVRPLVPTPVRRRRQARANADAARDALIGLADRASLSELREAGEQRRHGPLWWQKQVHTLIDMRDQLDMAGHFRREAIDAKMIVRHPLLYDLQLVETALRVAPETQFDAERSRPLLRDALRGLIPEQVRTRHAKSHFTDLVLAGMRTEETQLIEPLRHADAPLRAYVGAAALERWLALAPADRPLLGAGMLWRLAIANRWLLAQPGVQPAETSGR
jgi:asparagine synthase (glutamine-hydrolysing)